MVQSKHRPLFDRADSIVEALEGHFIETKSKKFRPVGRSYALLLDALKDFTSINDQELVDKVQSLLGNAKKQEESGNNLVTVNRQIYNAALNTLASRSESSPEAAQMIEDMISIDGAPIDQASFSIAMKAILSSQGWIERTKDTAASIESLLLKMEAFNLLPSQKTMTPILNTLSKKGKVEEIMHLLDWMEDMYQSHGWNDIRPNRIHFNTMISAVSRTDSPSTKCGKQAIQMLEKMKDFHTSGKNEQAQPDLVTYNAVLNAIAKEANPNDSKRSHTDNDICERAEALLRRMEDGEEGEHIVPDLVSYNTVLSAFMHSLVADAATKAQDLLRRMTENDIEPDLLSYTICINTLAKSKLKGSAQKAEDLLRILEKAYAEGNKDLKPDMMCYNSGRCQHILHHSRQIQPCTNSHIIFSHSCVD